MFFFFFQCHGDHRDLHSFPTRRSSDLVASASVWATSASASASKLERAPAQEWASASEPKPTDRKSTRLNSSHMSISYAVFCLKKKKKTYSGRNFVCIYWKSTTHTNGCP